MNNLYTQAFFVKSLTNLLKFASGKFLAITTAVMTYGVAHEFFSTRFESGFITASGTIAATFLCYFLIDHGLGSMIQFLFDEQVSKKEGRNKAYKRMVAGLIATTAIRLILTGTVSFWASPEIADMSTTKPKTDALTATVDGQNKSHEATLTRFDKMISEAKKSEKSRIANAKKEGHQKVVGAIQAGPQAWQRSIRTSDWYRSKARPSKVREYAASIDQAIQDSAALVLAEINKVNKLESEQLAYLSGGSSSKDEIAKGLVAISNTEFEDWKATKARRSAFLIIADIFSALMYLACSWILSLFKEATGYESPMDTRPGVSQVFSSWFQKVYLNALDKLEKLLKLDLNKDGTIGVKSLKPTPTPVRNPPTDPKPGAPIDHINDATVKELYQEVETLKSELEKSKNLKAEPEKPETLEQNPKTLKEESPKLETLGLELENSKVKTLKGGDIQNVTQVEKPENSKTLEHELKELLSTFKDFAYSEEEMERVLEWAEECFKKGEAAVVSNARNKFNAASKGVARKNYSSQKTYENALTIRRINAMKYYACRVWLLENDFWVDDAAGALNVRKQQTQKQA